MDASKAARERNLANALDGLEYGKAVPSPSDPREGMTKQVSKLTTDLSSVLPSGRGSILGSNLARYHASVKIANDDPLTD
jgi:hypothetical protein